jgi:S1-C subfamily serine protease
MKKLTKKILSVILSLAVGYYIGFSLTKKSPEQQLIKAVEKSLPKTVMITVTYKDIEADKTVLIKGSGVIITPDGYILTVKHLFNIADERPYLIMDPAIIIELYNGELLASELVKVSIKSDLALLRTWQIKDSPYAKLKDPRKLKIGQTVFAIGNPLSLPFTVTSGIISQLFRDLGDNYNVTQSDTSINPGNSGGPLFSLDGRIVGINSFMSSVTMAPIFTGLGFSVQSGQCLEFLVLCSKAEKRLRGVKWI